MKIKYFIIHHSAISRKKLLEQFDAIRKGHIKKGWGSIGYNWLIEPSGELKEGRKQDKPGAHCYGHNHSSLGICLAGNFDIEYPTRKQENTLWELLKKLEKQYPEAEIKHHRDFRNTHCPGNLLSKDWHKNLISNNKKMKLKINRGHLYVVEEASKFGWSIPEDKIALPAIKAHFEKLGIPLGDPEVFDPDNYFIVYGSTKEQIVNFFNV